MQPPPPQAPLEPHLSFPRIRPLDIKWVEQGNERYLYLHDPLGLTPGEVFLPEFLAPLVSMFDGEHNLPTIRAALALWRGLSLTTEELERIVKELDESLVLEGPRVDDAKREALEEYRMSPFRQPALAGMAYPGDIVILEKALDEYCTRFPVAEDLSANPDAPVLGILSPHIDYTRGHKVYAESWQAIAAAVAQCEQVIIFGTDHSGGPGKVTLTRQKYATPWGAFPSDSQLVGNLLRELGIDALEEELHHMTEHSIELAAVWLHYILCKVKGKGSFRNLPTVLPVLCGTMFPYLQGEQDPDTDPAFERLLQGLRPSLEQRRTLVVAAGDMAHVGPAFGDGQGWDMAAKARLRNADEASLEAICKGDARGFFQGLKAEGDSRRVCGLTPIYLALRLLEGEVDGVPTGYQQCPADPAGMSFVSIAGVVWRKKR
ncbi:MAG: AmmeMemoRadiSam system protein B [Chloroflexi bacterium]|nr:AmmeMemoRadiSam system protein B [Chloroflexota bacterium]